MKEKEALQAGQSWGIISTYFYRFPVEKVEIESRQCTSRLYACKFWFVYSNYIILTTATMYFKSKLVIELVSI